MTRKTIASLPAKTGTLADEALFEIEEGGTSKKLTAAQLVTKVLPGGLPDLSTITARLTEAETDIGEIVATYGSIIDAAQSAAQAEAARANAVLQRGYAEAQASAALIAKTLTEEALADANDAEAAAIAAASAAASSETAAGNSATTAAGNAAIATTKATEAGSSATSAQASANLATTKSDAAESSADAAATQAASAASSSSAAGSAAAAAITARVEAQSARDESVSASSVAVSSAAGAAGSASSASTSALLSASVGNNSLVRNPVFSTWPNPANPPEYWTYWNSNGTFSRVAGLNGGYAAQQIVDAGNLVQGYQTATEYNPALQNISPGWYVVEWDVQLLAGSLSGSGIVVNWFDASAAYVSGIGYHNPDTICSTGSAPGAGSAGTIYRFRKLLNVTHANAKQFVIYVMNNFNGWPLAVKTLNWHKASIRAATPSEIRDHTVLAPLEATVSTQASAIAAVVGDIATVQAKYAVKVTAGKVVGFELIANGVTSDFIVQADRFAVESGADRPFEVVGGVTYIKNAVIQNAAISTGKVVNNAITASASAFTPGQINGGNNTNWFDIQTAVLAADGGVVQIIAGAWVAALDGSGGFYTLGTGVRIVRDATVIHDMGSYYTLASPSFTDETAQRAVGFATDTPGTGNFTYRLQMRLDAVVSGSTIPSAKNRNLFVENAKK